MQGARSKGPGARRGEQGEGSKEQGAGSRHEAIERTLRLHDCTIARLHDCMIAGLSDLLIHTVDELPEFVTFLEGKTEAPAIPGDDV